MATRLKNVYNEMMENLEFITKCYSLDEIVNSYKKSNKERFDLYLKDIVDNSDDEEVKNSYDEFYRYLYEEFGNKLMLCVEVYFRNVKEAKDPDLHDWTYEDRIGSVDDDYDDEGNKIGNTKRVMLMVNLNINDLMDFLYDKLNIKFNSYSPLEVKGNFIFFDGERDFDYYYLGYGNDLVVYNTDSYLNIFDEDYVDRYEELEKLPNASIKIIK